ncbi:tRNA lysidine(34) synthetase TilS [Rhodohalobacter sp. 8-1]|uniref:tRNA lysidine(34) synthetase TilS n=1 Tax=Rhodohalobacter sp. 8-1 TaxID=3131972 RepID=UPI0030ED6783
MNRFESFQIVKAFRQALSTVEQHDSSMFICGVSGGVDSMVLLYLLHRFDVNCTVAHCNYQLRGEESDKDMELVEEISAMWGFDCITARFDPVKVEESNTQLWARDLRYTMFRDLKHELDAGFIITAHHRDDQVETILQKILRGAAPGAWSGMSIVDDELFRPLLDVTKKEILEFAKAQHVPFRKDRTNQTSAYARNLIRNEVSPRLDKLIPGWKTNLLRIPEKANQFSLMAEALLRQVEQEPMKIDRDALLALPKDLWPPIIHRFIEKNAQNVKISVGELHQTNALDNLQTGGFLQFGEKLRLVRNRDEFCLVIDEEEHMPHTITIRAEDLPLISRENSIQIKLLPWKGEIKPNCLQLDAALLDWPLTLRPWRDGDRIQPLGMDGHKQVADLLTDKKISTVQKNHTYLIESFDGIICAVIFPHLTSRRQIGVISEQFKCTKATNQILLIDTDV